MRTASSSPANKGCRLSIVAAWLKSLLTFKFFAIPISAQLVVLLTTLTLVTQVFTTALLQFEEHFGLPTTYFLRGAVKPPPGAVIIAMDGASAENLGVPRPPHPWPRDLHAKLLRRITEHKPQAAVFDLHFAILRDPIGDAAFVQALAESKRTLLFAPLRVISSGNSNPSKARVHIEGLQPPHPIFAAAAAGFGIFSLPKIPRRVDQFSTYRQSAGDAPNLVIEALKLAHGRGYEHLRRPPLQYLNFYGPARTIPTYSYAEALASLPPLNDAVVFIGVSEQDPNDQIEGFPTVFTDTNGVELSGVEIMATAYLNLLHGTSLVPLPPWAARFLYTLVVCSAYLLARYLSPKWCLIASVILLAPYAVTQIVLFRFHSIWLPLLSIVAIVYPMGALLGTLLHTRTARAKAQARKRDLALFLPQAAVDSLTTATRIAPNANPIPTVYQYGVCLASDASSYTNWAEHQDPATLATNLNKYYESLFQEVRSRGGTISDVEGDAMMALWLAPTTLTNEEKTALQTQACAAAFAISHLALPATASPSSPRLTRVGLHAGCVALGTIGALDHYEYRAVGDVVNTTSRIEQLGKTLGVNIIVSEAALPPALRMCARPLGAFTLRGKDSPTELYEIMQTQSEE